MRNQRGKRRRGKEAVDTNFSSMADGTKEAEPMSHVTKKNTNDCLSL
jgi:hypothetical protein